MLKLKFSIFALCGLALLSTSARGQNTGSKPKLNVIHGPARAQMEKIAQLEVPAAYSFLDGKATRTLMKAGGEPVSGHELGLLIPTNEHWSVMFEFADTGYVKDDDKDKLNPDELLDSIKRGTKPSDTLSAPA